MISQIRITYMQVKISLNQYINPLPPKVGPSHRNIFTAKLKSRTSHHSNKSPNFNTNTNSNNNLDHNEYKPDEKEQETILNHFNNLQLQDFLKVVIVGKSKLSQVKSKEIIRSLNGTWFRNTQANHPVSRLYCSLPIKKQKSTNIHRQQKNSNADFSDFFHNNYTPPNLFPKRRNSPHCIKSSHSRFIQGQSKQLFSSEIQQKVMQKITQSKQIKSSRIKHRAKSYFGNGKSSIKFFSGDNECLLGKKMLIHQ